MKEIYTFVNINDRNFRIQKFSARQTMKLMKIFGAKIVPLLGSLEDILDTFEDIDLEKDVFNMLKQIDLDSIGKALDLITEEDLDIVMDTSLKMVAKQQNETNAYISILAPNGAIDDEEIEYDAKLQFKLVVEVLKWGLSGFFKEGN